MSRYYRSLIQTVSFDADALAFLTAASITDPTITTAIDTLVIDLKAAGIWTKMKAVYPFVGGTASSHKFNLKDPRDLDAAFRLQFFGGITHNANGFTGNGSTGYASTLLNPSISLGLNNTHISVYSRTNNAIAGVDIGLTVSNSDAFGMGVRWSDNNGYYNIYNVSTNRITINSVTSSLGLFCLSRTANNVAKVFRNGSQIGLNSNIQNNVNLSNRIINLSADNSGSASQPSNRNYAFASIGDGLSDSEASAFYTAVQAFQTTLGRAV
jgi:hypothetical protein